MDGVRLTAEFVVRLSSRPGPEFRGEVTVISSNHIFKFNTYPEFVYIIEKELTHDCPHLRQRFRSWDTPITSPAKASPETSRHLWGSSLTFHLGVLFTENCTWQGKVQWLETKRSRYFRSFLELLLLLDEARHDSPTQVKVI